MRDDRDNHILVGMDFEVEPPASGDAGPPEVGGLVVFLGPQGRMMKVEQEELKLFFERLPYVRRKAGVVLVGPPGETELHLRRFFAGRRARLSRAAMASSAVA
jgi:hypothetical protein